MVSETTILKGIAGAISGIGAIYLCAIGKISPEATVAILAGLTAYFTGEINGRRAAKA